MEEIFSLLRMEYLGPLEPLATNALYDVTYRPQVDGTWWSKGTSAYGKYTLDGSELFFCVSSDDYPSSSCLPPTGWNKQ